MHRASPRWTCTEVVGSTDSRRSRSDKYSEILQSAAGKPISLHTLLQLNLNDTMYQFPVPDWITGSPFVTRLWAEKLFTHPCDPPGSRRGRLRLGKRRRRGTWPQQYYLVFNNFTYYLVYCLIVTSYLLICSDEVNCRLDSIVCHLSMLGRLWKLRYCRELRYCRSANTTIFSDSDLVLFLDCCMS